MINRRKMLIGMLATPVIVKASSLMPIKTPYTAEAWLECDGRWVLKRHYKELAKIMSGYNNDTTTSFRLPDFRYVLRNVDAKIRYRIATGVKKEPGIVPGMLVCQAQTALDYLKADTHLNSKDEWAVETLSYPKINAEDLAKADAYLRTKWGIV